MQREADSSEPRTGKADMSAVYKERDVVFSVAFDLEVLRLFKSSTPMALKRRLPHENLWFQFIDSVCELFPKTPLPAYLYAASLFCDLQAEYDHPEYNDIINFFRQQKCLFKCFGLDVIFDPTANKIAFVVAPVTKPTPSEQEMIDCILNAFVCKQTYKRKLSARQKLLTMGDLPPLAGSETHEFLDAPHEDLSTYINVDSKEAAARAEVGRMQRDADSEEQKQDAEIRAKLTALGLDHPHDRHSSTPSSQQDEDESASESEGEAEEEEEEKNK